MLGGCYDDQDEFEDEDDVYCTHVIRDKVTGEQLWVCDQEMEDFPKVEDIFKS